MSTAQNLIESQSHVTPTLITGKGSKFLNAIGYYVVHKNIENKRGNWERVKETVLSSRNYFKYEVETFVDENGKEQIKQVENGLNSKGEKKWKTVYVLDPFKYVVYSKKVKKVMVDGKSKRSYVKDEEGNYVLEEKEANKVKLFGIQKNMKVQLIQIIMKYLDDMVGIAEDIEDFTVTDIHNAIEENKETFAYCVYKVAKMFNLKKYFNKDNLGNDMKDKHKDTIENYYHVFRNAIKANFVTSFGKKNPDDTLVTVVADLFVEFLACVAVNAVNIKLLKPSKLSINLTILNGVIQNCCEMAIMEDNCFDYTSMISNNFEEEFDNWIDVKKSEKKQSKPTKKKTTGKAKKKPAKKAEDKPAKKKPAKKKAEAKPKQSPEYVSEDDDEEDESYGDY
jgi:hypothetical protein